jgi:hypothetical protein
MSTLLPNYSLTDFKKLGANQLKRLKSCEIYSNGEYLFTFTNGVTDYIRVQAEGVKGNAVDGEELSAVSCQRSAVR